MRRSTTLAFLLVYACGNNDAPVPGENAPSTGVGTASVITDGAEIAPNVVVLDPAIAREVGVEDDALVFSAKTEAVPTLAPGDFVVSAEGDGFLRQVTGVDASDSLRYLTRPAELTEVVINGALHASLPLDPVELDLSGRVTLGDPNLALSVTPLTITVTPTVELDLEILGREVTWFSTQLSYTRTTSAGAVVDARAPKSFSTGDIALWRSPKWRFVQNIGPIPIVEVVSIVVAGGLQGRIDGLGTAVVSSACDHLQSYGLAFERGEWNQWSDGDTSCSALQPTFSGALDATVEPYLKGTLAIDFYGVAGPYLTLRDGLAADLHVCPDPGSIALSSPASVLLGADLRKIGGKKYETTVFSHVFPIREWSLDTAQVCSALP